MEEGERFGRTRPWAGLVLMKGIWIADASRLDYHMYM